MPIVGLIFALFNKETRGHAKATKDVMGSSDWLFFSQYKEKYVICKLNNDLRLFLFWELNTWVNAWYSGPIFWSQCFFNIPHCTVRSSKNTLNISGIF
jgi:hypothetical protein